MTTETIATVEPGRSPVLAFTRAREFVKRFTSEGLEGDPVESLRVLLEELLVLDSHLARLHWLERLGSWMRSSERVPQRFRLPGEQARSQRLRFFLHSLKEYPAAREAFLANLRHALLDTNGLKLFADAGLPSEYGFVSESVERAMRRALPRPPNETSLGELLERMFTRREEGAWVAGLAPDLLMEMALILYFEGDVEKNPWRQIRLDMLDAITVLAADVASLGVSQDILDRLPRVSLRELPFLVITHECDDLLTVLREGETHPIETKREHASRVLAAISACRDSASKVLAHLEQFGVSVHLVYRLEKIGCILDRLESIVRILVPADGLLTVKQVTGFVANLIESVHDDKSVRQLVRTNLRQISRKLVERTGESGEHYIVRSREDYFHILRQASGGGFLTLFTTILKVLVVWAGLALFFEGLALAIVYAGSFIVMQMLGFKLATKQPALFAAAIAGKLVKREYLEDTAGFVAEVARITRSQAAAVAGNIGLIIPAAIAFDLVWRLVRGHSFLDAETASYSVTALNPIESGTLFYAALTGCILMASSLVGSWLENFIVYRRIPEGIAKSRRLQRALGVERAAAFGDAVLRNASGYGVSIALGFLLGMTPVIGKFLGLPLDVRHVTLSTGQLALGVSAQGFEALLTWSTGLAALGIFFIGLLNFGVSFALGLLIALRAREVAVPAALQLVRDAFKAFLRRPADFLLPQRKGAATDSEAPHKKPHESH